MIGRDYDGSSVDNYSITLFKLNDEFYALDSLSIERIMYGPEIIGLPNSKNEVAGVVIDEDNVYPIVDTQKVLNDYRAAGENDSEYKSMYCVLVDIEEKICGFLVDEVTGVTNVPIESIRYNTISNPRYKSIKDIIRAVWIRNDGIGIDILSMKNIYNKVVHGVK